MPKIPTYDSPEAQRGIQPSDRGAAAYEALGRHVEASFNQLSSDAQQIGNVVEQHEAMTDASSLSADSAKLFNTLSDSLNQAYTNADPSDTEVKQKWLDNVLEPQLEKFGQDVQSTRGQEMAQDLRDRMRMEFTKSAIGSQASFDAASLHTNLTTAGNELGSAVYADPSKLDGAVGLFNQALEAQLKTHPVSAEQAATVRMEIGGATRKALAEAAARGSIEQNPQQFLKDLQDGKYAAYLNGEESGQLVTAASAAQRLQIEQQKAAETEQRRQDKEQADTAAKAITSSMVRDDGSLQVPKDYYQNITKLALMRGADTGLVRSMIDMGRSVTRELAEGTPTVTDPHVYEDLSKRLTLPSGDPNALTDEQVIRDRADGKLSDKDYNFFKGALSTLNRDPAYRSANQEFNTFMKGIKSSITRSNIFQGTNDPTGDQKFLQFSQSARDQFEAAYKSNNPKAWHDLLDRNNPRSLWHQAVPYMTSGAESEKALETQSSGAPVGLAPVVKPSVQWKQGMSMDDLAKQLSGK